MTVAIYYFHVAPKSCLIAGLLSPSTESSSFLKGLLNVNKDTVSIGHIIFYFFNSHYDISLNGLIFEHPS